MSLEERIRTTLHHRADQTQPAADAWDRITSRLERADSGMERKGRLGVVLVAAAIGVAALALVVIAFGSGRTPAPYRSTSGAFGFAPSSGWHRAATDKPTPEYDVNVAWASTVPIVPADRAFAGLTDGLLHAWNEPSATSARLSEEDAVIVVVATTFDDPYPARPNVNFPPADSLVLPEEPFFETSWEGHDPKVESRVMEWSLVDGWFVDVRVYFGADRPSAETVEAVNDQLRAFSLPSPSTATVPPLLIEIAEPESANGRTSNPRFYASYRGVDIPLDAIETPGSELEYPGAASPVPLPTGTPIVVRSEALAVNVYELEHASGRYVEHGSCIVPGSIDTLPGRPGSSAFFIYAEWEDAAAGMAFRAELIGGAGGSNASRDPVSDEYARPGGLATCDPQSSQPRYFVPPTDREGGLTVLPLVFADGSRAVLSYPADLRVAELGFSPNILINSGTNSPCEPDPIITWTEQHDDIYVGDAPVAAFDGTSGQVGLWEGGKGWQPFYLVFRFDHWWVHLHCRSVDEAAAARIAEGLSGTLTPEGFLVLTGAPPLELTLAGEPNASPEFYLDGGRDAPGFVVLEVVGRCDGAQVEREGGWWARRCVEVDGGAVRITVQTEGTDEEAKAFIDGMIAGIEVRSVHLVERG